MKDEKEGKFVGAGLVCPEIFTRMNRMDRIFWG
jgi:hypothetical protein